MGGDFEQFKFFTLSRVTESKGITTVADAIRYVSRRAGRKAAKLYIYGEIDSLYKEQVESLWDSGQ